MANYVKFMRGTPEAYLKATKDSDTLYFISETDSSEGVLYLGSKAIGGSSSIDFNNFSIDALKDVLITEGLTDKSLLVYQADNQNWTNVNFEDLKFIGATEKSSGIGGFVPAPKQGQTNLFLRSDGKWVSLLMPENQEINTDNLSIEFQNEKLSLKNYGVQYYRYDTENNKYVLQKVDSEHPWISGLYPTVTLENEQLVIGWYEHNTTTVDGLSSQIGVLQTSVIDITKTLNSLTTKIGVEATETQEATGIYSLLDLKADKVKVQNIENYLNTFKTSIEDRVDTLEERLTWQSLIE